MARELSVDLTLTLSISQHSVCSSGCLTLTMFVALPLGLSLCRSLSLSQSLSMSCHSRNQLETHIICHTQFVTRTVCQQITPIVCRSATRSLPPRDILPEAAHLEAAGVARPPTRARGRTCRHKMSASAQTNTSPHLDSVHVH